MVGSPTCNAQCYIIINCSISNKGRKKYKPVADQLLRVIIKIPFKIPFLNIFIFLLFFDQFNQFSSDLQNVQGTGTPGSSGQRVIKRLLLLVQNVEGTNDGWQ